MLLIQTALEQEFRAVTSVLERSGEQPQSSNRAGRFIYGRIDEQPCCVVRTGIGAQRAERELLKMLEHIDRPRLLLSIGLAGALAGELPIGQRWLIGEVRLSGREPFELCGCLSLLPPEYRQAVPTTTLVSVDRPVLTAQAKEQLHRTSLASLCDMETHAAARIAVAHGMPWLGARVVSDSARETLPSWFLSLPGLVERRAWGGLFGQLVTHPQDLPGLLRLAVRMRLLERQLAQFTLELIRNVL